MSWDILPARTVASWILDRLFGDHPAPDGRDGTARTFPLAAHQEEAVRRASRILDRRGGVLIADSVGLGKTYIGLALIEDELRRGGGVVAVVPAALRPAWRAPLRGWSTAQRSNRLHLFSHTQLSRGGYPASLAGRGGLVVVDEAHRFRNPDTRRYGALSELCAGARVALLTATPVNNGVVDVYALLRLFATDDAFADVGVASLGSLFSSGPTGVVPAGPAPDVPAAAVRRVLGEVMVRRTRSMLLGAEALDAGLPRFPRRAPPIVVRYVEVGMADRVRGVEALELAPFRAAAGIPGAGGGQTALVRLGLLKRLDSSRTAFARSIRRQMAFGEAFASALEAGRLLRPGDRSGRGGGGDGDPLQLMLLDLIAAPWPPRLDRALVRAAVERDLERLRQLLAGLDGPDPKLAALTSLIGDLAPDKVIIFTEFRDTAEAIWRRLAPRHRVARIDGGGAWLGRVSAGRRTILDRFAPRSNGAREPAARERVDVLIATDVLAEGLNLQDARHVVCYDMPWNPIRVLQRIGRVDRLGSLHDVVVPHIFLPASGLEDVLGLTRRLRNKLGSIASTVGGEEAGELLDRLGGDPTTIAAALHAIETRQEDPIERLRVLWQRQPTDHGDRRDRTRLGAVPGGRILVAWVDADPGCDLDAVVLARAMGRPRLAEVAHDGSVSCAGANAIRLIERALVNESAMEAVDRTRLTDRSAGACAAARWYFDTQASAGRAPRASRAGEPATRLARRLRATIGGTSRWLDPAIVARADRAIQRLDRELPPRLAAGARALVAEARGLDDPVGILDRVEALLEKMGPVGTHAEARPDTIVMALLLARHPG